MSTSELRGGLWIMVTDGPLSWFSTPLSCLMVPIFDTSITHCITVACYIVEGGSRSSLLIWG